MSAFQTQIITIAADTTSKDNILDLSTSAEPEAWWAADLQLRVSVFSDAGVTLLDVSDIQSATLSLKDPGNLDGTPLVTQTLTVFDNTTTLQTWQSGAQQQLLFTITADQLSFAGLTNGARLLHLSISAITTGGKTGVLCVGTLNVIDAGDNSPNSNPVNAITVTQAQAMLAALAWTAVVIDLAGAGATALTVAQAWLLGRQPFSLGAGSGAYVANIVLSDANVLPGALLRIPIDFPASANPTVNIYDAGTGGTLIEGPLTNPNPGAAASFLFTAGFDGAHWHKESGAWVV
jgi:hypothetical protein